MKQLFFIFVSDVIIIAIICVVLSLSHDPSVTAVKPSVLVIFDSRHIGDQKLTIRVTCRLVKICFAVFVLIVSFQLTAHTESEHRLKVLAAMKQSDGADQQQLAQLEQDIRDQDKLITGYQIENEKLCSEMKRLRAASKSAEEKMFQENQKLQIDVGNLRYAVSNYVCAFKCSRIIQYFVTCI